ncbi:MAG: Mur ligase family protein [Verrucomicrobium sp.]|nr:Mur ligase family protein [Verrucomicrobium sp.]
MDYAAALAWLGQTRRLGMKLGLGKMEALAAALGSPEKKLRFVHIAGTNGKGSTAAFCAAALRARGLRTGLYTSPHLRSVRERIQVDGVPISREAFAAGIAAVAAVSLPEEWGPPTFFEAVTAVALRHFAQAGVEWAVWETGLGGRLDATNIVTPAVTIVTNIGTDHREFLGDTPEAVAAEKAGIFKPGVPAVTGQEAGPALDVLRRRAEEKGAPLTVLHTGFPGPLGLRGPHQARNAACAAAALRLVLPFADEELSRAFATAAWPGRFQVLRKEPPLVVDGAHNPEGIAAAVAAWKESYRVPYRLVFGAFTDKDSAAAARLLLPGAARVDLVGLPGERAAAPESLLPHFPGAAVHPSLAALWPDLGGEPALLLGSLTLAAEALRLHEGADAEETQLNELLSPAR